MSLDKYIPGVSQGVTPNPLVIDITYAELVDKISLSALIPGQKYRITDYRTAYNMPNVTPAEKIVCTVEPLLVTANSVNTLSMYAYSEAYPQDEIYYNPTSDQVVMPGCDKGYIYRRIDKQKNNDITFDYRNVKFRRWLVNILVTDTTGAVANYTIGSVVNKTGTTELYLKIGDGNTKLFTDTTEWIKLPFANNTYSLYETTVYLIIDDITPIMAEIVTASPTGRDYYMFSVDEAGTQNDYANVINNKINISATYNFIFQHNTVFKSTQYIKQNVIDVESFYNNHITDIFINNNIKKAFFTNYFKAVSYCDFNYGASLVMCGTGIGRSIFEELTQCWFDTISYCKANYLYANIFGGTISHCEITNAMQGCRIPPSTTKTVFGLVADSNLMNSATLPLTFTKQVDTNQGNVLYGSYINANNEKVIFDPSTDAIISIKEYTALLSETGYAATSGLLIAGQTYYIASYVAGDDFTNVGGTNVTGNTFTASGTTPTTWTNSSILVSVGISAPAVTLLANSLSGAIVWTYSAVGTYIGTLSGAFTENKTVFSYPPLGDDKAVTVEWTSANVITVKTYETGALKDGLLVKFPLTIKVYP